MLFVIDKPQLQRIIAIVRDDRRKDDQGLAGPFLRLEARDDYVKLDGLEVSGEIPATVYEPGVLFLKATQFRRQLRKFKGEKFLTIQVTGDALLMGYVRMPLESNEMLLYPNPDQAPPVHPVFAMATPAPAKRRPVRRRCSRQLTLWPDFDIEVSQDDKG
jgi:hypothetical protein